MTADRIRLLLHEAIDIDRLMREYCWRALFPYDEDMPAEQKLYVLEGRDVEVNLTHVEDLLARLGEIYETAQARAVIESVRKASVK